MLVILGPFDRLQLRDESSGQHFIDMRYRNDFQSFLHARWNLREILFILGRNEDGPDATSKSSKQLLLQSTDGKHSATQRDFAGHGNVTPNRHPAKRRD